MIWLQEEGRFPWEVPQCQDVPVCESQCWGAGIWPDWDLKQSPIRPAGMPASSLRTMLVKQPELHFTGFLVAMLHI